MTALLDHTGRAIQLGAKLGVGGEAAVFELAGQPGSVAKLYHAAPSARRAAKLSHMVQVANPELLRVAAWPQHTLHEVSGRVVGFAMPKMTGFKELHLLYGTQSRRREFPKADWHFLVHVARNCAAAFDAVHRAGAVIGDINGRNILASADDATVRLIDCDSFQLEARGNRFLCEVGVPEFTPPELQGKPLSGEARTLNHDAFGLAVLVFHLLFVGRHPFFGTFLGPGDMPQERAIKELRFAFGRTAAARQMQSPPHSLALSVLPPATGELFERAFSEAGVRGGRPDARSWLAALTSLIQQIATCTTDPAHKFPATARSCPWCGLAAEGGPAFFVSPQLSLEFRCAASDLDALLVELDQAVRARPAFAVVASPPALPAPASPSPSAAPSLAWILLFGGSLVLCSVTGTVALMIASPLTIAVALGCTTAAAGCALQRWWSQARSTYGLERRNRLRAYAGARQALDEARRERERASIAHDRVMTDHAIRGRQIGPIYARLSNEHDAELAGLTRNLEALQRTAHLRRHEVRHAEIKGIGVARKNNLLAYGIETAEDVLHRNLTEVPGLGPKLREALLVWAHVVAASFRFDAARSVPRQERGALVARYRQRQQQLRGELEQRVAAARAATAELARTQPVLRDREATAELVFRRAEAELAAMPPPSYREIWLPVGAVALMLLIVVAIRRPPTTAAVPVAKPVEVSATPIDDFAPGTQILRAGTGTPQLAVFMPREGRKQRLVLVTDAERTDDQGRVVLPELTVQALVAIKDVSSAGVVYQVLVERAQITDARPLDVRGAQAKREVGRLAGTLISFAVSPRGELRSHKLDRAPPSGVEPGAAELADALAYMFFELPDQPISSGAQWRIRAASAGAQPFRVETMATAIELDAQRTILERNTTYTAAPGGGPFEGALETRLERRTGDIVPTLRASYHMVAGARQQAQRVAIRPL
jgi:DNA-binding helix-hairpin-helix protein with protein kinase domain